jgi:hypothetical protein
MGITRTQFRISYTSVSFPVQSGALIFHFANKAAKENDTEFLTNIIEMNLLSETHHAPLCVLSVQAFVSVRSTEARYVQLTQQIAKCHRKYQL